MIRLSVIIPVYEMHGKGIQFLKRNLDSLTFQTFKNFEVVVSDNSDDDEIKKICDSYSSTLNISYWKNPDKGMAPNTNFAIQHSKGELIKILYQDDFFKDASSLQEISDNFMPTDNWLVTACATNNVFGTPNHPIYSKKIMEGANTIGSPTVLTIRNNNPLLFDRSMTWMLDCDYYIRLYKRYGPPKILDSINVIIGLGKHQTTNVIDDDLKQKEKEYLMKKYLRKQATIRILIIRMKRQIKKLIVLFKKK